MRYYKCLNSTFECIAHTMWEMLTIFQGASFDTMNVILNFNFIGLLTGGKKNRQKERRLMKGFNLAVPGAQGTNVLPPVAEFMSPFHSGSENCDLFGSPFAGLMNANSGITPRRNPMYSMQQYSSSQSSFSESFGTIGRLGKIGSKLRNTSQKRRWGNSIKFHQTENVMYSNVN